MRNEASSDVLKVWLHAAASVLLGAWISPLLYNTGKGLAEVSEGKQTNGPLEWLAGVCRTADFPAFFAVSLLVSAAILFLPLIQWLRGGRQPEAACGQRLRQNPLGARQAVLGFSAVTVLFLGIAGILVLAGVFVWKNPGEAVAKLALRGFSVALGLAVLQEILFRGIAMGIFLRAMRPAAALGLSAVLFALVHFLNPPPGLDVLDPDAAGTGFELLRKIAARFSDPRVVLGVFAPLLALGGVLAYARWRTASLWLPIGLHAGWIFVNAILASVTTAAGDPDSLIWLISGPSLQQGLLPLVGIVLAGVMITRLTAAADAPL